ncbi:MAG TPA: hypothetical protein VEW64_08660 [Methyloceanibacter sp.]|jgi:hypothetical protein|nr:hypothetical protein [Methyloceanibacter sp.]
MRYKSDMPRALLTVLAAFAAIAFAAHAADQMEAPKEMTVLTVTGEIGNTNRGAFDSDKDSLFSRLNIAFDRAFAFDRPMLLRLKQGRVVAKTTELGRDAVFTGPLLKEVLAAVGAAPAKLSVVAVNNYEGWLAPEDIDGSDWILALEVDGAPLGLGQQGPIWLINTRAADFKPDDTQHAHWVWAVFYMRVGD